MEYYIEKTEEYLQNLVIEDFLSNSRERPAKREQIILEITRISEFVLTSDNPKEIEIPVFSNTITFTENLDESETLTDSEESPELSLEGFKKSRGSNRKISEESPELSLEGFEKSKGSNRKNSEESPELSFDYFQKSKGPNRNSEESSELGLGDFQKSKGPNRKGPNRNNRQESSEISLGETQKRKVRNNPQSDERNTEKNIGDSQIKDKTNWLSTEISSTGFQQTQSINEPKEVELTNSYCEIEDDLAINEPLPEDISNHINDNIVLIISLGRSGSTSLVHLFNNIPNSNICGENYNAVLRLMHFYYEIKEVNRAIPTSNILNTFNIIDIRNHVIKMILLLFKKTTETTLWGFKEVRWSENLKMIGVFRELFPTLKIIVNLRRDIIDQSRSSFWKTIPNASDIIVNQQNDLLKYLNENNFNYRKLFMEDFNKKEIMGSIYEYIGCSEYFNMTDVKMHLDFIKESYKRQPFVHIHTFFPAKFKFIHIPKTGGSAIEKFIKPYKDLIIGFGHDNVCRFNEHPIVVIRYPLERFVSMYYYWKYGSVTPPFTRDKEWLYRYRSFTIKDFITLFEKKSYKNLYQGFTWDQHFMPVKNWLDEASYSKTVIVIYEKNLQEKVYKLMDYIGLKDDFRKKLYRVNISRKDVEVDLDDDDIKWITKYFKDDFELWDKIHSNPEIFKAVL